MSSACPNVCNRCTRVIIGMPHYTCGHMYCADCTAPGIDVQREEAIRIAADVIAWAKASGVSAGAVIEAETRLARVRNRASG